MWKIKLRDDQKLWVTSDPHYNHKNICEGTSNWTTGKTRPFQTLEKMNARIVDSINTSVGQDDILICLGDWSFGGFESIEDFRNRIVCKNIYLIYGNHDHHIANNRGNVQSLFTATAHYETLELYINVKKGQEARYLFTLCHFPICSWHDMNKGRFHLFGHMHLGPDKKMMPGRSMDVGMDGNDLEPYEIRDIIRMLSGRPVSTNSLPNDHHLDVAR